MNPTTRTFALLLTTVTALGCDIRTRTPSPSLAPAPAAALPSPASPSIPPEVARLPLADRLVREAATRPAIPLSTERVQQALAKQGVALQRWKQVLASPVGARFCMAGLTAAGLAVSICEYPDANAAARGAATSHARFDQLIPNRSLVRNGATLLTLTHPSSPDRERLGRIFAAL